MADLAPWKRCMHSTTGRKTGKVSPLVRPAGQGCRVRSAMRGPGMVWCFLLSVGTKVLANLEWLDADINWKAFTSAVSVTESMLKGFNSLCDIQLYWKIVEEKYLQPSCRQDYQCLIEPIAKLYSHILEYQARVICHLSSAQLSRAWENVAGWNDWDGEIEKLYKLSEQYSSYLRLLDANAIRERWNMELQKMQESQTILDDIRTILETSRQENQKLYDSQKVRDLLRDLASDYETCKDYNPKRVQGTCEWFFTDDRFRKWRSSDFGLLWVTAGPGCGKSVLSRALIDERRLSTSVATSAVCYFFFKDGDKRRMYATNALGAILHQLFTQHSATDLIEHAIPSHENFGKDLTQNLPELWRILTKCAQSPNAGEIVCVLDALDECQPESRQQLIRNLKELYCETERESNSRLRLKFLITSRPYDDLEASFRDFFEAIAYVRFDGDEKAAQISKDIDIVIDAKVDAIAHEFREEDRRKIAGQLKNMENRTYLWLHLTFGIIEQRPGEYSRRSDMEALLSDLPSQVSEAYEKILNKSGNQHRTEALLQIILAAARPLTLDEANVALTMALENGRFESHDDVESKMWPRGSFKNTVKSLCGLFINVYDSKLYFIHQTAKEFLIHQKQNGRWQGRLDLTKSHRKMALICLNYLRCLDEQESAREIKAKCPLAQYSAKYWMDHVKQAEMDEDVQEAVLNFFLEQKMVYTVWGKLHNPESPLSRVGTGRTMAPPLYYASAAGLRRIAELLLERGADVNAPGGMYNNALQVASFNGHKELAQLLLERGAVVNARGGSYGSALQAASLIGHKELARLLVERGADVNAQGGQYGNALQAASYQGNQELVELLLQRGANVNSQGGEYGNSLQAASYKGHKEVVELLLEAGADINAQGGSYGTALQAAAYQGHKELTKLLLERGADIETYCDPFGTALQAASRGGYKELVQLLLKRGAEINTDCGYFGNPLQAASVNGFTEVAQLLLEKGADVNAHCGHFGSALQAASANGFMETAQLLLENGADVNAQGGQYGNALQAASYRGNKELVELLLENGANVNMRGGHFDSALQAASAGGYTEVVQLLLEAGADPNVQGGVHGNALKAACYSGCREIVQLLLEKGADANAQAEYDDNALQAASYSGNKELVELLLEKGADVNARGGPFGSALQAACHSGNTEVVELLLERGADINTQGGHFGNALQAASYMGHKELVELLLDRGADINAQGGRFGNVFKAASWSGNKELIKLLEQKGADGNTHGSD